MTDDQQQQQDQEQPGPYSFEVRFGGPAIAEGVVPIPRILVDTYAHLGIQDREFAWIAHLLAYKWTAKPPFPKRSRLNCSAGEKSQQRIARHLRELGLLFTQRRMRHGRVIGLVYDLDSLLHNCVRLHEAIEAAIDRYLTLHPFEGDREDRNERLRIRDVVLPQVKRTFKIELPDKVMTRLRIGTYDDVAPPWDKFVLEQPPDDLTPEEQLDFLFPREEVPPTDPPVDLGTEPNSKRKGKGKKRNWAVPVEAGGSDQVAEAVADLVCQYNGISSAENLPPIERRNMLIKLRQIIDQWGGGTLEQARLAMQAWTIRYSWKATCNVHYDSFPTEMGMLLTAVREGTITQKTLKEEQRQQDLQEERRQAMDRRMGVGRDRRDYREYADQARPASKEPAEPECPPFWQAILDELKLQMTQATFDTWLRHSTAKREDGQIIVITANEYGRDWLENRLADTIERTVRRICQDDSLMVRFETA